MAGDQVFVAMLAAARRTDCDDMTQIAGFGANGIGVFGEQVLDHHGHGVARGAKVGDLGRGEPEVGRHPDATQAKRHPAELEHLHVVARLHEDLVALADTHRAQGGHHGVDASVNLGPGPRAVAHDEGRVIRIEARRAGQQIGQVGDLRSVHTVSRMLR